MGNKSDSLYDADSIKVLKGLDAVRKRPGMYIGNTDEISGLHHMLYEVVDNAIDEALAGHCKKIIVILYPDGSASVEDDGRGIPVGLHKEEGISAAEVIMTQLHAGGKFSQDVYKVSGGLHGVGVSVVNALSKQLTVKIWQGKKEYCMEFERGVTTVGLKALGPTSKRGTFVRFLPDPSIFSKTVFDYKQLCLRFRELAFLNPGISITIRDERDTSPLQDVFFDTGGVESFAKHLCGNKQILNTTPLTIKSKQNDVEVDCTIFWTAGYSEQSLFFTNTIPQHDGGTHVAGLRSGLTKSFQNYIKEKGTKAQQKAEFVGEDIREGMVCVLSVKVPDPKFSSQTKEKLVSSNVRQVVEGLTTKFTEHWLEENPSESSKVIQKVVDSANAREAARRARDLSRKNKSSNELNLQVAKRLAGCSEKDPSKCELFIVEGDSAGGSAKQARDRFVQAVLPLRGKILNIEKVNFAKALTSEIIATLVAAIGTGIGDDFNISKLKYHKIIIMTDADVDGKHISALLLTFFFRYMRPLIESGHIYLANPPLYGIIHRKNIDYIKDDKDFAHYILKRGISDLSIVDGDSKPLATSKEITTYLNSVYNIKNILTDRMHYYAVSAKLFGNEQGDQLDLLMNYMSKTKPGTWKKEGEKILCNHNGVEQSYIVDHSKLARETSYTLVSFTNAWGHLWGDNVFVDQKPVHDPFQLFDEIMHRGRRGLQIQRYKGLGEMNPRELGSTTMKVYTQVTLEQTEEILNEANQMCADLMGENVAARRRFIESNAKYAEVDL